MIPRDQELSGALVSRLDSCVNDSGSVPARPVSDWHSVLGDGLIGYCFQQL